MQELPVNVLVCCIICYPQVVTLLLRDNYFLTKITTSPNINNQKIVVISQRLPAIHSITADRLSPIVTRNDKYKILHPVYQPEVGIQKKDRLLHLSFEKIIN